MHWQCCWLLLKIRSQWFAIIAGKCLPIKHDNSTDFHWYRQYGEVILNCPNPSCMKTTVLFTLLAFLAVATRAQIEPATPWVWMKGDHETNITGIYGTKGFAAPGNKPGSRTSAVTWRDQSGNLWLFGGMGYGNSGQGYLNDLWKFNPETNQWTWISGDSTIQQYSVYGTQGTPSATNKPGGIYASVSWADASGNLWLYGGFGYTDTEFGFLNTLWKYSISSNQWTWVKGDKLIDKTGSYGTRGNEHTNNKPGARYGSNTWTDANGNLWLFGGYGYNSTESGILNDLWRYNPSTNKWAWINGDNAVERTGVYGTKTIAASGNKPGARYVASSWNDADGNFWLFGGYGYDATACGTLNDIWKYNPVTNQWTWMNGKNLIEQTPVYGTRGTAAPANTPGSRYVSSSWTDPNGELWLFGGYGLDSNSTAGYLNDFWKYSPFTNTWTWIKGNSTADQRGIYGVQGAASSANITGARQGSVSWTDNTGNLWLFGGYGFDDESDGILNDLWKISSYNVVLPVKLLAFTGNYDGQKTQLKWTTENETGFSRYEIQRSTDGQLFSSIGELAAKEQLRNEYGFTDYSVSNKTAEVVYYRLKMIDQDGKFNFSKVLMFTLKQEQVQFRLFPNPAVNIVTVSTWQEKAGNSRILLSDMKGTIVKQTTHSFNKGSNSVTLDCSGLASGMYLITLSDGEGRRIQEKLIIRR